MFINHFFNKTHYYLQEGAKYDTWCDSPGVALLVYAQLARDFGWTAYKSVFRTCNKFPEDKRPSTQQEKENMWVQTLSNVVKRNLSPVFEFWGWPIQLYAIDELNKFLPYLPDDVTTREFAKDRATKILQKYQDNSSVTRPTQKPPQKENTYCPSTVQTKDDKAKNSSSCSAF